MATLNSVITKLGNLLSSLNTKTGRSDTTFNAAISALPSKKTDSNVSVSGKTVTTPAGIYFSEVQKSVSEGELPTPQISVSSSGVVTATVDMVQSGVVGYIPYDSQKSKTYNLSTQGAATITPTTSEQTAVASGKYTTGAVKVAAIPSSYIIPSGTKTISSSGTHDVKAYANASVASGSATVSGSITANPSLAATATTITAGKAYKMSVSGSKSITPTVTEGYVKSGTAGTVSVSGEAYVMESSTGSATSSTTDTATRTIGYNQQTTISAGYYPSARIIRNSVAAGKASTPATTITKNPSISVNSSGLISASVSGTQSVTPSVTAGYVSSGTAGTITVSGSFTKKATDLDTNLVASNIKNGVKIFGVTGNYTGGGSVSTTTITIDTENVFSYGYGVDVYYTVYENGQVANYHTYVDAYEYRQLSSIVVGSTITFVGDFWLDDYSLVLKEDTTQNYQYSYVCNVPNNAYYMFWE